MRNLLLGALIVVATVHGAAQNSDMAAEQARIASMENAWNQAIQQKDTKALTLLLGPELVFVDYDGTTMNRDQYLAKIAALNLHPQQVTIEWMNVYIYGLTAIVNGVYREKGTIAGRPYSHRQRFTDTWLNRGGNWTCIASHSTKISD